MLIQHTVNQSMTFIEQITGKCFTKVGETKLVKWYFVDPTDGVCEPTDGDSMPSRKVRVPLCLLKCYFNVGHEFAVCNPLLIFLSFFLAKFQFLICYVDTYCHIGI